MRAQGPYPPPYQPPRRRRGGSVFGMIMVAATVAFYAMNDGKRMSERGSRPPEDRPRESRMAGGENLVFDKFEDARPRDPRKRPQPSPATKADTRRVGAGR